MTVFLAASDETWGESIFHDPKAVKAAMEAEKQANVKKRKDKSSASRRV